jgi:hypothetical protein
VPRDVDRASLYRAPINLWVEDELTRAYLDVPWNRPDIAYLIGGGFEGALGSANDAKKAGCSNVFAVIDSDFRRTNKPDWMDPDKTFQRFILPGHEIENYLLDPRALAASRFNNLKKTDVEIESMMTAVAKRLCWWAACRDEVARLRKRFREGFMSDPSCAVCSEDEARNHICQSRWFQSLAQKAAQTTEADIHQSLSDFYERAIQSLADGSWKVQFSGKEVLHDVQSRICHLPRIPQYNPKPAQFGEDLAKEVGAWQRDNGAVPADLAELLVALQQRVARGRPNP